VVGGGSMRRNLSGMYEELRPATRQRIMAPIVYETAQIVQYNEGNGTYTVKSLSTDLEFEAGKERIIPHNSTNGKRDVSPETRDIMLSGNLPANTVVELRPIESEDESDGGGNSGDETEVE